MSYLTRRSMLRGSLALAAALRQRAAGTRILLARADRGRELLQEELRKVADVERVTVYAQVDLDIRHSPQWQEIEESRIDYITLTSSNIARALVRSLSDKTMQRIKSGVLRLVSISPVTSAALAEFGLPVAAEAKEYTTAGLVAALVKLAKC